MSFIKARGMAIGQGVSHATGKTVGSTTRRLDTMPDTARFIIKDPTLKHILRSGVANQKTEQRALLGVVSAMQ